MKGKKGFPKYIADGYSGNFDFLAMELLGPTLKSLFEGNESCFSNQSVSMIGIQLLDRLETLHNANIVHADIKPENVGIGFENRAELYLFDFGLSQTIINADEPMQIYTLVGTLKYASIGAHDGIVSFRNDIESLAYMLLYLMTDDLPWNLSYLMLTGRNQLNYANQICDLKKSFLNAPPKHLPAEMLQFLAAIKKMSYVQRPDYEFLRNTLK